MCVCAEVDTAATLVRTFSNQTPDSVPDNSPLGGWMILTSIRRRIHNSGVTSPHPFARWGTVPMLLTFSWLLLQKGCVLSPDMAPAQTRLDSPTSFLVSAQASRSEKAPFRVQRSHEFSDVDVSLVLGSTNAVPSCVCNCALHTDDGTDTPERYQ